MRGRPPDYTISVEYIKQLVERVERIYFVRQGRHQVGPGEQNQSGHVRALLRPRKEPRSATGLILVTTGVKPAESRNCKSTDGSR